MKCYCGMDVPEGRLHYPGNDPENGGAHKPQLQDPHDVDEKPQDWPMCERCEKEVQTTIDIWVQGNAYYAIGTQPNGKPELDSKTFELNSEYGRDYIVLCEPCWKYVHTHGWAQICAESTVDHVKTENLPLREFLIRIPLTKGREDNVPSTLQKRIQDILTAAFAELIDEGDIDIIVEEVE